MKYEIPWCTVCRDWHLPGPHTRAPGPPPSAGPAAGAGTWTIPPGARVHGAPVARDHRLTAAYAALGCDPTADRKATRSAFRSAILRAHPDQGGSEEAAKKVIAARDELRRRGLF